MRRNLLIAATAWLLCSCQSQLFTTLPATGNTRPVIPALLRVGEQTLYLTDYFPEWNSADSVTSAELLIQPLDGEWTRFTVTAPQGAFASTMEFWQGGRSLSVVALGGERRDSVWMFSEGQMMRMVSIRATQAPTQVVALWQNCRLPAQYIVRTDTSFGVIIPADAADVERSVLRVFAVTEGVRLNDLLIPLQRGRVIREASQLTRHDRQGQVLYSLMIDRFQDGETTNNHPLNSPDVLPQADYQGGDVQGITNSIKQGFFDSLGVTTLWISPITQNPYDAWGQNLDPKTKFSGYHGYWPIYTTRMDERFGTPDALRELLSTAHARGMNVILDYVANHLHINSPMLRAHPDWVTPLLLPDGRKNIGLWDEQRLTTWFDEHIPSLDLEREEVCEPMTDSALYWVTEYDFDGFRHDACKHIPENYWRMLTHKMRTRLPERDLWQIGETYGSPELIGSYVRSGMIDAQFDFNVYHTALDVFTRGQSLRRLAGAVEESVASYGAHHTMGNITGNHDKGRFVSLAGGALSPDEDHKAAGWKRSVGVGDSVGYQRLALLQAINTTIPGVPCIYQGDEYGEPGGNDPDNRRMMRFEGYTAHERTTKAATACLIHLRRSSMPLLYGDLVTLALTDEVWLFVRIYMGEYVVVAVNISDRAQEIKCTLPVGVDANQKLKTNFGGVFGLKPDGALTLSLAPYGYEILTKTNL